MPITIRCTTRLGENEYEGVTPVEKKRSFRSCGISRFQSKHLSLLILLSALLFCGCGAAQTDPDIEPEPVEAASVPTPSATQKPSETIVFPDGTAHSPIERKVAIPTICHTETDAFIAALQQLPDLQYVYLGKEGTEELPRDFGWKDIQALQNAFPNTDFQYTFTLFGKTFHTLDQEMNFHHVTMDDEGAAVREVLPCMTKCRFLNMDFCGVSSEHMAEIRDSYPEMEVVWRIWFGTDCSVRTDVERILASNLNHKLSDSNTQDLKYCTKVRLLDIGHNTMLHDFSFLEYMPDLEVAIICITGLEDLTPVSSCTKLEYLEINTLKEGLDLSPLGKLTNLEHLCACYLGHVRGWEALENLTKLKRLWFGRYTYLPEGAVEELQAALPNTVINTTNTFGCAGDWRYNRSGYTERYALLREQFEYSNYGRVSSSWYNDPEFFKEGEYHYRPEK